MPAQLVPGTAITGSRTGEPFYGPILQAQPATLDGKCKRQADDKSERRVGRDTDCRHNQDEEEIRLVALTEAQQKVRELFKEIPSPQIEKTDT